MLLTLLLQACRALLRHKVRSGLNVLGISIGIAAVVWVVAIGEAGSEITEEQFHALGDNLVWVEAGSRQTNGVRSGTDGMRNLTVDDAEAIRREIPSVQWVSPNLDGSVVLQWQTSNWTTRYRGISPDYEDIKRWEFSAGASFTDEDVEQAANVCVLGDTVRQQLFGASDPEGQLIRLNGQPFTVVGVLAPKGQSATGRDQDDEIHVPYTTAMTKIRGGGQRWLDDVLCSASGPAAVKTAGEAITTLMRERHRIAPGEKDDFNIRDPGELIAAQMRASDTLETLLVSIAAVALLVGGIGLMNVMLASVVERTREIGVRLAVGARPSAIQIQFLLEAVLLSAVGAACGIAASIGGTSLMSRVLAWPLTTSPHAVFLSVLVAVAVGVVFGYIPAQRAAGIDPITALHHQ